MSEENILMKLVEKRAMIYIPENSVSVEISAIVYNNDGLVRVGKTMTMKEIQESFKDADDNYSEDDVKFVLTEKGEKYFDSFLKSKVK